jgi:hypothetical protein
MTADLVAAFSRDGVRTRVHISVATSWLLDQLCVIADENRATRKPAHCPKHGRGYAPNFDAAFLSRFLSSPSEMGARRARNMALYSIRSFFLLSARG